MNKIYLLLVLFTLINFLGFIVREIKQTIVCFILFLKISSKKGRTQFYSYLSVSYCDFWFSSKPITIYIINQLPSRFENCYTGPARIHFLVSLNP